ncbi:hypothetical protein [Caballeronia udeis]|uniref:hypothetical protein n=1 Tax=Caballeronia udeis TaxID=1232866 RepID=UPI000A8FA2D7|nr:hypothetical protein [Caballeronia udeis]
MSFLQRCTRSGITVPFRLVVRFEVGILLKAIQPFQNHERMYRPFWQRSEIKLAIRIAGFHDVRGHGSQLLLVNANANSVKVLCSAFYRL